LRSSHFKTADGEEELTIHFSDVVVSIEGTSLYATLKVCLRKSAHGERVVSNRIKNMRA